VDFAFIEANCGGECIYDRFCCRDGQVTVTVERGSAPGLMALVGAVEIQLDGRLFFEPFVRGYFVGHGSGGAE